MSETVIQAMKYAIAGTAVGVGVAMATDFIDGQIIALLPMTGSATYGSVMGRQAFRFVFDVSLAAGMIYGGDQIMNMVGPDGADPLFRLFYYQFAFHTMHTTYAGASSLSSIVGQIVNGLKPAGPPMGSTGGSSGAPMPSRDVGILPASMPCSAKGGCGALQL